MIHTVSIHTEACVFSQKTQRTPENIHFDSEMFLLVYRILFHSFTNDMNGLSHMYRPWIPFSQMINYIICFLVVY